VHGALEGFGEVDATTGLLGHQNMNMIVIFKLEATAPT
jgi:hypothetical protein